MTKLLLAGLIVVVLLSFFNFQLIPIAWLDEIMDFDPAFRLVNGQGFTSLVWPYENSNEIFVATLPVRNLPYIFAAILGGADYHWIRTFFYLLFVCFLFVAFRLFKKSFSTPVVLLLLTLFILDKGVYESVRSVRPEIFQLILLCLGLWFLTVKKQPYLAIISQSLLFLIHPSSWALVSVISLYAFLQLAQTRKILIGVFLFCIPIFIWLLLMDFPFENIQKQFLVAGNEHSANSHFATQFKNHFMDRYWPQYMVQPWVWMMYLAVHVISISTIIMNLKQKTLPDLWSVMFLAHSVFWFVMLAPHPRYNPTTLLLTYFIFTRFVLNLSFIQNIKLKPIIILVFLMIHSLPFAGISFLAITQYQERVPKPVFEWLDQHVKPHSGILIGGESIAAYWSYKQSNEATYFEPIYPQHINFMEFQTVYILNREELAYEKISHYEVKQNKTTWIQKLHDKSGSLTYNGLILYKLTPIEAEAFCLKARKNKDWQRYYQK